NATKEAEQECHELEVDAYLTKPIKREALLDTVFSLVDIEKLNRIKIDSHTPTLKLVQPKTNEQQPEVIDVNTLDKLALLGENKEFMSDLAEVFLNDSKKLINSIIIAHNNSNYHDLAEYAHALKGSAQSIGATGIGNIAALIYKQSLGTNYDSISIKSNSLMQIHDETTSALNKYLDNLEITALN
ncbi:MAG: Hpt domain-containing protein, partial [Bacteroidia bacterium]|nr:Hpt domain-containing protein [Bacteroidia bacterium]